MTTGQPPDGGNDSSERRVSGRYALFLTGLLYGAVLLFDTESGLQALISSADILVRIAPVLLLVTVFIGLSKYFLTPNVVARYVGAEAGPKGYFIAAGSGILSHGPVYVWYALLRDLRDAGMRDGLIAVFLYNRAIKLPLLPLFVLYFDLDFAAVLFVVMTAASVIQGLIVDRVVGVPE